MREPDFAAYFDDAITLRPREVVVRDSLLPWLPDTIIDCHTHCNRAEHVSSLDQVFLSLMMSTFPAHDLEQSYVVDALFYPGKDVRKLRFPHVFRGIDHKAANEYLLNETREKDRVAVFGLPSELNYTLSILRHPRNSALKMYPPGLGLSSPPSRIYDYFRPAILREAEALRLPIILHLPDIITACIDEVETLVHEFPALTVVLAHMGLPHFLVPGLEDAYLRLAKFPNVYVDTSTITTVEIIQLALATLGAEKIMYGSDDPISLVRGTFYKNPRLGPWLATEYNYHWVNVRENEEFGYLGRGSVHMNWGTLQALHDAIEEIGGPAGERAKALVFHDNAARVFGF